MPNHIDSESETDKQIRLLTINELLDNPTLPIDEYNRYALMKRSLLTQQPKTHFKTSFSRKQLLSVLLIGLIAFSCAAVVFASYPQPKHFFVSTGTMINSPVTGSDSISQTNTNSSNSP